MKLQNTRLGAFNGIKVGEVIDAKDDEIKGYLDVGFTEYVEKDETEDEKAPVATNTVPESKKVVNDAKAEATKIVATAKLEAAKIVDDAKIEAEEIKKLATDEAEKIVADAKVIPEATENKEVSTETKETKIAETTQK